MSAKSQKRYIDRAAKRKRRKLRRALRDGWLSSLAYFTSEQRLGLVVLPRPAKEGYFIMERTEPGVEIVTRCGP